MSRAILATRVALAFLVPFEIQSVGLIAAESMSTPAVQGAAFLLSVATGFALLPPQMRRRPVLTALAYVPVMLGMLWYFSLWFVGYFFGDSI
jgi:hypothetical protein